MGQGGVGGDGHGHGHEQGRWAIDKERLPSRTGALGLLEVLLIGDQGA